jgi:streptomycin 6-kinase
LENLSAAAVPADFARRIREAFKADGEAWLTRLPSLLVELARDWELSRLGGPFELSYNYVAPAIRRDGAPAVLKVGVPQAEFWREMAALGYYDGDGACRVLRSDAERCAMLLEHVLPGEMLVGMVRTDDDQATRIGASVLRKLWRPAPADSSEAFCPVADWFTRAFDRYRADFGGGRGPLPESVFGAGVDLARALFDSGPASTLLHGDFHHYNVLSATRAGWLAIDPKGMTGDRGYDVGPFVCNPRQSDGYSRSPQLLRRRLDILADELEYDRPRLRDWSIAHAVLSACWSIEANRDGDDWRDAVAIAQMLMV